MDYPLLQISINSLEQPSSEDVSIRSLDNIIQILKEEPDQNTKALNKQKVSASKICLNNEDILSQIASYLLSPSFSYICKSFAKANLNLRIHDTELSILINNDPLRGIQFCQITRQIEKLEKILNWVNSDKLNELKNNQSKLGLTTYTKYLLQEISVSALPSKPTMPERETEDQRCGGYLSLLMLSITCTAIFYDCLKNLINHEQTLSHNISGLFFSTIALLFGASIAYVKCTNQERKQYRKEKRAYEEEFHGYFDAVTRCFRILQNRIQNELTLPNNPYQFSEYFTDVYRNNPEAKFTNQARISSQITIMRS